MKVAIPGYATLRNNETEPQSSDQQDGSQQAPHEQLGVKPLFQKMIFVLIDALRADFVLPLPGGDLPRMEFVSRLVDNKETFSFLARAHAPTVTMPRIKVSVIIFFGTTQYIYVPLFRRQYYLSHYCSYSEECAVLFCQKFRHL